MEGYTQWYWQEEGTQTCLALKRLAACEARVWGLRLYLSFPRIYSPHITDPL